MSELMTMVEQQGKKLDSIEKMVHQLSILVMKNKVNDTWVNEDIAAEMVGYNPETFRRKVKDAHKKHREPWNLINFRNSNGRNWQYSRRSLENFQKRTSIDQ